MPYDIDLRPCRVTLSYLRRDGSRGRVSMGTWAADLKDAKRLTLRTLGTEGIGASGRAEWLGDE